jgi:hypothetical protein
MGLGQLWRKFFPTAADPAAKQAKAPAKLPPYHAVMVAPTPECCDVARNTVEHPILSRTSPRLPLPGCTMPTKCVCKFRKREDRRVGERRFFGLAGNSFWSMSGSDKRQRPDRRG